MMNIRTLANILHLLPSSKGSINSTHFEEFCKINYYYYTKEEHLLQYG